MTLLHYLCKAKALDIGSIDFHNSIPWLQGVALLPVPDSLHDSHPASRAARHHAEAEAPVSFTLGQGHRHQLPGAQTAHAHRPRGGHAAGTGGGAGVAMVTVEATVLGAVRGWRSSEVRGLRSKEAGVRAAGPTGGRHGPPRRVRQGQPGPRQGAGGQVTLRRLGGAVTERMWGCREGVIVVITDHGCSGEKEGEESN